MRLLLRETVENLGSIGDVVEVKAGFARNYLVPKGIGVAVTAENIRQIAQRKLELIEEEAKRRADMARLAEVLVGKSFRVAARAQGDEGKLYGSVGPQLIAEALQAEGYPVEAKMVLLDRPIKELGIFEVRIRLFTGVDAQTKVWVVEDTSQARAAADEDEAPADDEG